MRVVVTGGAGFIGSAVVRFLVAQGHEVLNVDKLTYAASPEALREVEGNSRYHFLKADICDRQAMTRAFRDFEPDAVMHLAAESHVDRSIEAPAAFINTNIIGTYTLLEVALGYWEGLERPRREAFRFHHVSTDEVFGSLGPTGLFTEDSPYRPNSPYSASKAAADHLVRAWHKTYGLPVVLSNCSNNYGPYQFPEKLIPLMTIKALRGEQLPVYGTGGNVRDWVHVEDHVEALWTILTKGRVGRSYNVGGGEGAQKTNLEVVRAICGIMDRLHPEGSPHEQLITFVPDRPGHDLRYAMDITRITTELGWSPSREFAQGLEQTVQWYLDNEWWWGPILERRYQGQRLGLGRRREE